jgi:putative transposase
MRKSKFTPHQIAKILKEFDAGKSSEEISREHGISNTNLVFKCRINKLSLSKVCKGEKIF